VPLELETRRLRLRPFTPEDAAFALELLNEPAFLRFIGDKRVRDLDSARHYLEAGPIRMVREHGHGLLRVAARDTDEPLGMCGLLRREGFEHPDLGFAFLARHRRRGYALEASREVLEHARRQLGIERVLAIAAPDNTASEALLARLGLFPAGVVRLEAGGEPCVLFTPEGADQG
jgi:RimJ/RimL family protein N-acetyltransferase